jgi:hypothetical protein
MPTFRPSGLGVAPGSEKTVSIDSSGLHSGP